MRRLAVCLLIGPILIAGVHAAPPEVSGVAAHGRAPASEVSEDTGGALSGSSTSNRRTPPSHAKGSPAWFETDAPADDPWRLNAPFYATIDAQVPNINKRFQRNSDDNRRLISRFREAGFRWIYTWVAWSDLETDRGVYRWQELDSFLTDAHDSGVNVILQVMVGAWGYPQGFDPPLRTHSNHPGPPVPLPVDTSSLGNFWFELVNRYKPGGVLATERGWDSYGVRIWEVENEPENIAWATDWSRAPKDYAEYLSVLAPAAKRADPEAVIAAPALSHTEGRSVFGGPKGTVWLNEVLTPGHPDSEWASDEYRSLAEHPGGGPFIDVFSFHRNNPRVADFQSAQRAREVRQVVDRHLTTTEYPVKPDYALQLSEGGALQYTADGEKMAWAQAQNVIPLLAEGVGRIMFATGTQTNRNDWTTSPLFKAIGQLHRLFPAPGHVVRADSDITGGDAVAFRREDPVTGVRTYAVWSPSLPEGSRSGPGAMYEVEVPVRTATAEIVGWDWSTSTAGVQDGRVLVTVRADDPSPVIFVTEVS